MDPQVPAQRDIHGNIAATPVANMLHTVRDRRLTGRGTFQNGPHRVELAFREGQIVHAASNDPDQRLGEILLSEAMIRLSQYIESVQVLLETGKRQGEVLVDLGYLDPNDLKRAVRVQMKEITYWVMSWTEGSYVFRWTPPIEDSILLSTSIYELILRGMRRCNRFSKLREVLAPFHRRVTIHTEMDMAEARQIRLKEDETTVLGLIDGARSVASIIDFSPYPDMQTMQILFGLKWARIINILDDGDPGDTFP